MWQYGPIDPGSGPIIWVYTLVTAFCTVMTVMLYRKWSQRRTTSSRLLLITFTSYLTCIIITALGFMEVLLTLEKRAFYGFSLAF
nr:hypothetical protein [Candidatus Sigynarchaeota archaeon]